MAVMSPIGILLTLIYQASDALVNMQVKTNILTASALLEMQRL